MIEMKFGLLLIMLAFASENQKNKVESAKSDEKIKEKNAENLILVKIEEDNHTKPYRKTSKYFGVSYSKAKERWGAQRRSKNKKKVVYNGVRYKDEETAALASDALARKLMANGEQNHKLNFPDDDTVEIPEKRKSLSKYFGVSYNESYKTWCAQRWSKSENKMVYNGNYENEEVAAHASDTLARKLMNKGEQNHQLNFPDDKSEVLPETKTSKYMYIGVSYCKSKGRWRARRRSKSENKMVYNGSYKNEEAAAHASDTLARKLMANGEQNLKLNFHDVETEQRNKRKRSKHENVDNSQNK